MNDDCHEDYKGFEFEVNKGDILAIGGVSSFIADKDFDPLVGFINSQGRSCIRVKRKKSKTQKTTQSTEENLPFSTSLMATLNSELFGEEQME